MHWSKRFLLRVFRIRSSDGDFVSSTPNGWILDAPKPRWIDQSSLSALLHLFTFERPLLENSASKNRRNALEPRPVFCVLQPSAYPTVMAMPQPVYLSQPSAAAQYSQTAAATAAYQTAAAAAVAQQVSAVRDFLFQIFFPTRTSSAGNFAIFPDRPAAFATTRYLLHPFYGREPITVLICWSSISSFSSRVMLINPTVRLSTVILGNIFCACTEIIVSAFSCSVTRVPFNKLTTISANLPPD